MLSRKKARAPGAKGRGAAAAKQMGLFMDPEEMMDMQDDVDDTELEAEFAALVGRKSAAAGAAKPKAKAPVPMEHIEKMAEDCMKDVDDEEDEDLEGDEDLLAELQEVVGDEEAEDEDHTTPALTRESAQQVKDSAAPGSLEHTLAERIQMYQTAVANANASGEASKARRYERGLKSLETMLTAVKKGSKVNESEIPPPVVSGACGAAPTRAPPEPPEATAPMQQTLLVSTATGPSQEKPVESSSESQPELGVMAREPAGVQAGGELEATKAMLLERQREYKLAALKAKQSGDTEQARALLKTGKRFDAVLEALENGQPVDLSNMPPVPGEAADTPSAGSPPGTGKAASASQEARVSLPASAAAAAPAQPKDTLEALEQRMAKYQEAYTQAKESGDSRKARMHERIAKQYQSAIRTHKAGKAVNFEELPVPPGFPPIPGLEKVAGGSEQSLVTVLEAANKLAADDGKESAEDEDESELPTPGKPQKPLLAVPPSVQVPSAMQSPSVEGQAPASSKADQQLDFLESRKKQYMKAALQAKQKKDMEQAKTFLRVAKSIDPIIEAARSGKAVDLAKVPSPPGDEDEDFILVHHSEVQVSEKTEEVYSQLFKLLNQQYEKCLTYSTQFSHMGNITETTKFEKMAEGCKKNLEILKLAQVQGLEPPKHHFEDRTYKTVRIFPELSSTEMVVVIVKGMNVPAPHGIAPNDLDAFVKFEFPYPSTEQPQKHKTAVVKNTNCPEYNQSFTLNINRNHRGFRRVIQSKGLKLEVLHKGGFLRSDKLVGTALLKLEKLEMESEVREIVEVMEGRKPTGGLLEVRVRLREPLSGQDVQTVTEHWLILDQPQVVV
ncbi:coiled-coil and C2 domain-containing protein 1B [Brienomyrus brachyistius]|uniref:coiled-coil and C2 domain-containing protein 1B n=1 Tax=Brienomyrus brachyistius TaxID=42636 RepID=UPI0020B1F492|nr:coiled-coil and C2 domain-containing protein 1B [Brienomyrus brachyistius]XP_048845719.1 coiled-coil and C2 domain-containing protein 1B [Brienomyrus brachyistius]